MKLYVGNLSFKASESELERWFIGFGIPVDTVTVIRDRFSGDARGFGFVEITETQTAERAISLCNGKEMMGRALIINEARPQAARGGRHTNRVAESSAGDGSRNRTRY